MNRAIVIRQFALSSGVWAVLFHEGNNVISFPGKRILGFFISLNVFCKKVSKLL